MLTETEFARFIVSWKNQMGEDIRGRFCVPIDRFARIEMFKNLIKSLIELHGYKEEDFEGKTYRMVMEASVNPNSERKEKWREAATTDWFDALDTFYPKQLLVHNSGDEPERPKRERLEPKKSVPSDSPVELENPLDKSLLGSDIADPVDEIDHEFLKLIEGKLDE